jgi:hypothetical protein
MNRLTSTGIPAREFNAVKQFLIRSTVPLVYESSDVAGIQGTGCLFEQSGNLYFVTAGHVLEGLNPDTLGIPLRQIDSEIFTLGEGLMGWSKNDKFDVGAYRIDDKSFAMQLRQSYTVLSNSNVGPTAIEGRYIIPGYPRATIKRVGNTLQPADLTQVHTGAYDGEVIDNRASHDLFFKWGKEAESLWGHKAETPSLKGISGAPVWLLTENQNAIWSPEGSLCLVGLQVSCDPYDRYIRALSWPVVAAALDELKPVDSAFAAQPINREGMPRQAGSCL